MPNVQPPQTFGLAIGSNYYLYSPNGANCDPITGLTITITVTQDIVWQSSPIGGAQGFAFQLNAFSPIGTTLVSGGLNAIFPPCGSSDERTLSRSYDPTLRGVSRASTR